MLAPAGEALVEAAGFCLADAEGGLDACGLQSVRCRGRRRRGWDRWWRRRRGDAGGDEGLRAGRGAAGVVAGFEGDVGGAASDASWPAAARH